MDEDKVFHQVGKFFTHFPGDLENIIEILNDNGYGVCETMDGDMIIMKAGEYNEDELPPELRCDDDDDDDFDDDYGDMTSGRY